MPNDAHAMETLDIAFTAAQCGSGYRKHPSFHLGAYLHDHPDARYVPLEQIVEADTGSSDLSSYCRATGPARINNENSLFFAEQILIRWRPHISLLEMGRALHVVRSIMLLFSILALIRVGTSLVMGTAILAAGVAILKHLEGSVYSTYPWIFVTVLALIGTYSVAALPGLAGRPRTRAGMALLTGIVGAFGSYMRTSYLPVYVALDFAGTCVVAKFASQKYQSRRMGKNMCL